MKRIVLIVLIVLLGSLGCVSSPTPPQPVEEPDTPDEVISGYYVGAMEGVGNPEVRGTLYTEGELIRGTLLVEGDTGYTAVLHVDGEVDEDGTLAAMVRDPGCDDAAVCGLQRAPADYEASGTVEGDQIGIGELWRAGNPEDTVDAIGAIDLALAPRDGFKPVEGNLSEPSPHAYVGRVSFFIPNQNGELAEGFCSMYVAHDDPELFWLYGGTIQQIACEHPDLESGRVFEDLAAPQYDEEAGVFWARLVVAGTDILLAGRFDDPSNDAELEGLILLDRGGPLPSPADASPDDIIGSFFFVRD